MIERSLVVDRFPDGIVIGLVNEISAEVQINPPPSTFVNASDELLILRPNGLPKNEYRASAKPAEATVGEWTSQDYVRASFDESYMGKNSQFSRQLAMTGEPAPQSPVTLSSLIYSRGRLSSIRAIALMWLRTAALQ